MQGRVNIEMAEPIFLFLRMQIKTNISHTIGYKLNTPKQFFQVQSQQPRFRYTKRKEKTGLREWILHCPLTSPSKYTFIGSAYLQSSHSYHHSCIAPCTLPFPKVLHKRKCLPFSHPLTATIYIYPNKND